MKVLVTAASRHGSTTEIAERIGAGLAGRGWTVCLQPPGEVTSLDGFAAVILGSAVYTGGWLKPARRCFERFAGDLTGRPLWLFSSGPVGDPAFPHEPAHDVADLMARSGARDHAVFAGKVDPSVLGLAERLAVRAVRVAPGDYRDWAAIDVWTTTVADTLDRERHSREQQCRVQLTRHPSPLRRRP